MGNRPKHNLQYTCWRKDRRGSYHPYARLGKYEMKMSEYTMEEVIKCREMLAQALLISQNLQSHGVEKAKKITPFKDFFELWSKHKSKEVRPFTLEIYSVVAKKHILPFLGEKLITEITRRDIQNTIDRPFFDSKSRTAQDVHKILSNFFKFCLRENFLEKSPFVDIDKPKHEYAEIEIFDAEEARKFLRLVRQSKYALLFEIGLITGMRPEEYFGLRWSDIDFINNQIYVRKALNLQQPNPVSFHDLKTKNSRRFIPLGESLMERLKNHREQQTPNEWNLVFTNDLDRPLEIKNVASRYFKPLVRQITNKKITLYSLRHTCATLLLMTGENPKTIAQRLGNTVEMTLKTYSHVLPNMQRSASEKLEKMLM